ncbi:helix-turn-helix domain-containing protein [Pseudoalteromonas rubra]|uniref:DNA-binding protein n=1 Tax=Pseudoalteromonas rubra TaxID=43658 RepID=A0A5S3X1R4_9GAMM|nr:helix-turn-helix domain-containing protein [Pseudoalteromonas rubra]TMP38221.1 DNA-binding protein [Pseudoalteromonas rubra]
MGSEEIFTVQEVSQFLKIAEKTTYRLALKGEIPGFKVGGSWRFRKAEIEKWIREQEKQCL